MTVELHLDDRPLPRRIGLIALATDHTTEPDFHRILSPRGIVCVIASIPLR